MLRRSARNGKTTSRAIKYIAAMPVLPVATNHSTELPSAFRERRLLAFLQLCVQLIALGRKDQSTIEKLVQQAQQFHLAVEFDRAVHEALALQEFPEMVLGYDNCPAEVGKCDPLGGAAFTDFDIPPLDVAARLGEHPFAKVLQDFLDMSPQFLDRDFTKLESAGGSFEFRD